MSKMKTKYKHIHFLKDIDNHSDKPLWICRGNRTGGDLGCVVWYSRWRQYCFFTDGQAVFSIDCLADIIHFIGQLAEGVDD